MKRFSIRSLFCLIFAAALSFAIGKAIHERYVYRTKILPAWEEFPVSAEPMFVAEKNDIAIFFERGSLELDSNASFNAGDDFNLWYNGKQIAIDNRDIGQEFTTSFYDLDCDLGKFRVIFMGESYSAATKEMSGSRSLFNMMRESFTLNRDSPVSKLPLWELRSAFRCDRLQHFEASTKKGFVFSFELQTTMMEVFDSSGEYCIRILPIAPTSRQWSRLADHIVLLDRAETLPDNDEIHGSGGGRAFSNGESTSAAP